MTINNGISKVSLLTILNYIVLSAFILYFGRTLLIPLSFSLLISFILYPVCKKLEKWSFSRSAAIFTSLFLLLILFALLCWLLLSQINDFRSMWPSLQTKLGALIIQIRMLFAEVFNIKLADNDEWINNKSMDIGAWLFSKAGSTIYSIGYSLVMLILIPLMSALLLYYRKLYISVLIDLFSGYNKEEILDIVHGSIHSYASFIKGMAIIYLIVGILNSFGLALLGIPHPILFGFIASILTFIPYVGILIASLLPITVAWLTYNSIWYPLGVIGVFTVVQYLEANVIFPWAVSNKLNLNMLATFIAIITGGILWGASGMILFVPFLSILKLISEKSPKLQSLARLLGTSSE
jgi:predicted PurR-regulated permease PerM